MRSIKEIHDCTLEDDIQPLAEQPSQSKDNAALTISVDTVSYRKLLEKEKRDNQEEDIIIINKDVRFSPPTSKPTLNQNLARIKEHAHSSCQVFLSLVK